MGHVQEDMGNQGQIEEECEEVGDQHPLACMYIIAVGRSHWSDIPPTTSRRCSDTGPGTPMHTDASRYHLCVSLTTTAAHPFIPFSRLRDPTRHAPAARSSHSSR